MPTKSIPLRGLDVLGGGGLGYTLADFIVSTGSHIWPTLFSDTKWSESFYGLCVVGSIVAIKVIQAKLEENHYISQGLLNEVKTDIKTN